MSLVYKQKLDYAIGIPFVCLIGLVTAEAIVLWTLGCLGRLKLPFQKTIRFILGGLILFGILRFATIVLWIVPLPDSLSHEITNRLAWLFFNLTFIVLLFGWIEAVHAKYPPPTENFVPVIGWIVAILCLAQVVELIVTTAVYGAYRVNWYQVTNPTQQQKDGEVIANNSYDVHVFIMCAIQFLIALGFLVYGIVLVVRLFRTQAQRGGVARGVSVSMDARRKAKQRVTAYKVVLVGFCLFVCFALKGAMFLYRPITGQFMPDGWFYFFAYILPEVLPCIIEMFVIVSTHESKSRESTKLPTTTNDSKRLLQTPLETNESLPEKPLLKNESYEEEDYRLSEATAASNHDFASLRATVEEDDEYNTLRKAVGNYDFVEDDDDMKLVDESKLDN